MSETTISREIREMIRKEFPEIWLQRLQTGIIRASHGGRIHCAEPGSPDYIGCLPDGRILAIEVKDPNGKTIKERQQMQDSILARINAAGGVAFKTTSVEDCRQKLEKELLPFG